MDNLVAYQHLFNFKATWDFELNFSTWFAKSRLLVILSLKAYVPSKILCFDTSFNWDDFLEEIKHCYSSWSRCWFFLFKIYQMIKNNVYSKILLIMQNSSSPKQFITWFNARYFNSAGHKRHIFYCSFQSVFILLGPRIFISYLGRLPFCIQKKPICV